MAGMLGLALALLAAGSARAALYPSGGSGFAGGPEGWSSPQPASCNIPLGGLCTANAGYDGTGGNPGGSLALNSSVLVNLGGLFKSVASFVSPDFTVGEGGTATVSVERRLAAGDLLDLAPQGAFAVRLVDRTTGVESTVIADTVAAGDSFAGRTGAAKVVAGHTYALAIDAELSSTVAKVGLLGSSALRFDNVALAVGTSGGGGGAGGGSGGSSLTNQQLASIMRTSLSGSAVLRGKRLFVRAKCPKRVGRACRVTVQGLLKKGRPVTGKRTARIGKGQGKLLVLRVKPRLRPRLAGKQRLLFRQTVRAGKAKATVYKRLKLVRR